MAITYNEKKTSFTRGFTRVYVTKAVPISIHIDIGIGIKRAIRIGIKSGTEVGIKELEQEKHLLKRRLDTTQGEYEARILELQNDIRELTTKIDSRDTNVKQRLLRIKFIFIDFHFVLPKLISSHALSCRARRPAAGAEIAAVASAARADSPHCLIFFRDQNNVFHQRLSRPRCHSNPSVQFFCYKTHSYLRLRHARTRAELIAGTAASIMHYLSNRYRDNVVHTPPSRIRLSACLSAPALRHAAARRRPPRGTAAAEIKRDLAALKLRRTRNNNDVKHDQRHRKNNELLYIRFHGLRFPHSIALPDARPRLSSRSRPAVECPYFDNGRAHTSFCRYALSKSSSRWPASSTSLLRPRKTEQIWTTQLTILPLQQWDPKSTIVSGDLLASLNDCSKGQSTSRYRPREEEKAGLIAELTAQNSRLTAQLKESSATEAQLLAQLEGLKDQYIMRKTSLQVAYAFLTFLNIVQDHVQSLESLKAELALVCDKKADLERRLTGSLKDKENLMQQLDEANDRIMALERQLKEQETLYQNTLKELERLQRSHDTLAERLGAPDSTDVADPGRSLHAELEAGPDDRDDSWLRSEAISVYKQLRALALQLNTGHDDDSGESN
ncbi:Bicaudal D-related protein homolog [Eumeta japonica]|uniref:Bicaudal D-related protein homolog n=1 Tax=Eumeta variegata TaxID=151549 RepID=A0A4C1YWV7_EUMVA|nr:Bicaudal D-related protein homolog [Eumeta japonica]